MVPICYKKPFRLVVYKWAIKCPLIEKSPTAADHCLAVTLSSNVFEKKRKSLLQRYQPLPVIRKTFLYSLKQCPRHEMLFYTNSIEKKHDKCVIK